MICEGATSPNGTRVLPQKTDFAQLRDGRKRRIEVSLATDVFKKEPSIMLEVVYCADVPRISGNPFFVLFVTYN
jgi:hypothetical protein